MSLAELLYRFAPRSDRLRHLCELYANSVRDQGSHDVRINGELRLLEHILPGAHLMLDIGANVGNSAREAFRVEHGLEIHCFEPDPAVFHHLETAEFPAAWNLVRHQMGMGAEAGSAEFFTAGGTSELGSLHRRVDLPDSIPRTPISVPVTTVDVFLESLDNPEVDFVKIDVEGAEFDVLAGMLGSLRSGRIRFAQFEYGSGYIGARRYFRDVFDLFSDLDYQLFQVGARGLRPVESYDPGMENFVLKNYLLARPGEERHLG